MPDLRKFIYDGREFADPDPDLTPDQVRDSMAHLMPELANAEVQHRTEGDHEVYEFRRRVGTKGGGSIVEIIASVPAYRPDIIDLVNELTDTKGELDYAAAQKRQGDINLACAQVDRYASDTRQAIDSLWDLPPRAG